MPSCGSMACDSEWKPGVKLCSCARFGGVGVGGVGFGAPANANS